MSSVHAIDDALQTAGRWVGDLAGELGEDREEAYRALRAVLHALRDRLPHEEAAQLAAQLPVLLRGVYYEGWRPARTPEHYHDVDPFLERVQHEAGMSGETEASFAAGAVMAMLRRHVSEGEIADVLAALPEPVRGLLAGT